MKVRSRFLGFVLTLVFFFLSLATIGCAHHPYRYYDEPHGDYHTWDNHEVVYYQQWAVETHRDPHRDFRKLNRGEQNEYWNWRHNHPDR